MSCNYYKAILLQKGLKTTFTFNNQMTSQVEDDNGLDIHGQTKQQHHQALLAGSEMESLRQERGKVEG